MTHVPNTPPSKVERAKLESCRLRGTIAETISSDATHFSEDDVQLLKFHGVYQQDDRDVRAAHRRAGLEKSWSFMSRLNIPGGALSSEQYLALDALATSHANGSLRITSRQSIQFHGTLKGDLPALLQEIDRALLTTMAACGDVLRNVMAPPAPIKDDAHETARRLAREITLALSPKTGAYREIWIDGERIDLDDEREPVYGEAYLPRKFKVGIALDTDNSIDVHSYDCGLLGVTQGGRLVGFNLLVGGGFGMTHRKPDTFARIATPIGFVQVDEAIEAVRAVVEVFRDFGNRSDRRHARLKYLIEEWGLERFRDAVAQRAGWTWREPVRSARPKQPDHLGLHEQGDGRFYYGVFVQSGRIVDSDAHHIRGAFRAIARELSPSVHLTPMQSVIFGELTRDDATGLLEILKSHGVARSEEVSNARRRSVVCPALPLCGLALAESERVAPELLDALADTLALHGLEDLELSVRMTGCPNGCARPYNADIGIVGRRPGVYHVYVGGGESGDRLAELYAADVAIGDIPAALSPLLGRYAAERTDGESLGGFLRRISKIDGRRTIVTGDEEPVSKFVQVGLP